MISTEFEADFWPFGALVTGSSHIFQHHRLERKNLLAFEEENHPKKRLFTELRRRARNSKENFNLHFNASLALNNFENIVIRPK